MIDESFDGSPTFGSYPTCPLCGAVDRDAWELSIEDGESTDWECRNGHHLIVTKHVSVDYTTEVDVEAVEK